MSPAMRLAVFFVFTAACASAAVIRVLPASASRRIFLQRQRPNLLNYRSNADHVNLGTSFGSSLQLGGLLRSQSGAGGVLVYGGDTPDINYYNPYDIYGGDAPDFHYTIGLNGAITGVAPSSLFDSDNFVIG